MLESDFNRMQLKGLLSKHDNNSVIQSLVASCMPFFKADAVVTIIQFIENRYKSSPLVSGI